MKYIGSINKSTRNLNGIGVLISPKNVFLANGLIINQMELVKLI